MSKFLMRFFSAALVAATVVSPSYAQLLKKQGAGASSSKPTATMKVQRGPVEKNAFFYELKPRSAASQVRTSQSSAGRLVNKAVAKVDAQMPTIYGSVFNNDDIYAGTATTGLYELPKSEGPTSFLFPAQGANGGGVCLRGAYRSVNYMDYWGMLIISYVSNDMDEGQVLGMSNTNDVSVIGAYALDPTSDAADPTVYGITFNTAGTAKQLSIMEFTDSEVSSTLVAPVDGYWNSIAFDGQGQLYGITYDVEPQGNDFLVTNAYLNKVDKTTGEVTLVAEITGAPAPQYMSSCCIDPKTGKMYWNVCPADNHSYMYEVDLATGVAQLLYQLPGNDEIMGMFIPAPPAEDGAPAECGNVQLNFEGSSLSGNVSLTAPATFFDGTPGSGELIITVLVDGEQLGTAEAAWGADIEVPVDLTLLGAGKHTFLVFPSNEVGMGPKTKIKDVWIGADTPMATTATLAYADGNMNISWLPVTTSVNGGYLDLDNLTYTVKDKDGAVVAEGLKDTSYSLAVAEPEGIVPYFYTVEVVCGDLVSAQAKTNVVVLGSAVPPYEPDFLTAGLDGWTLIDGNQDGYVWSVLTDGEDAGALRIRYNSSLPMDDWLITPPLRLEAGRAYRISFDSKAYGTTFKERLEVKFGRSATVDGMTDVLLEPTDLVSGDYVNFSNMIIPEEDGLYYVGFHGISDKNKLYLFLNNIRVEEGVSAFTPGLVSNLTATPDATGANRCTVSFNAPDKTMNGQTLESLTKIDVFRNGQLVKTFDSPSVGAELSFEDVMETGGNVTYSVIGHNTEGEGLTATVTAFVGFDIPAPVTSASIVGTDVDGEAKVSWEPVTSDINGLPFPEGKVTYTLATYNGTGWIPFVEGVEGTSYTYQAVETGKQEFVQVGVFAVTEAGNGTGAPTPMIPLGTPYNGLYESCAGGIFGYIWGSQPIEGGSIRVYTDESFQDVTSQDGDGGFVSIYSSSYDGGADLFSGLVSLEKMVNPGLTFYAYNSMNVNEDNTETRNINEISVSVREFGTDDWVQVMEPATVDELCDGNGNAWGKIAVSLEAYAGKTVQICITGITKVFTNTLIDNIRVQSILDNDLNAMSVTAPVKVKCGDDYDVRVRVVNDGALDAESFTVELYADGNLAGSKEVGNLASTASADVEFSCTMSALATGPVSLKARVIYAADGNGANNETSPVEVMPVASKLPGVDRPSGVYENEAVTLTWNEPDLDGGVPERITDDFEDGEPFTSEYGDWTFVDGDGSPVGGFYGLTLPGIISGQTPGSFWIWDQKSLTPNPTFDAHSGDKYLFSLFRQDNGKVDDWAISPQLTGEAQTVSFWAKSYDPQYPETFRICYSTTGKNVSDFIEIDGAAVEGVPGDWTEYTFELPAGSKYFAINSCATDSYMLMIDDVTYTPMPLLSTYEIAGYNVYRDGVKINSEPLAECEFVDNNVEADKEYRYVVTVLYTDRGESTPSDELVLSTAGIGSVIDGGVSVKARDGKIFVFNAEGRAIVVSSVSGSIVYSGVGRSKTEIGVPAGVYAVKAGNKVVKVIVK